MTNTIIVIVAIATLIVLGLITVLNILTQEKRKLDITWSKLDKALIKRRDTVPYLLESARISDPRWKSLKDARAALLSNQIPARQRIELEEKLGNAIEALIAIAKTDESVRTDTGFLESKKDLRKDIPTEINPLIAKWTADAEKYNDKLELFPYSIAAKIFRQHAV